MAGPSWLVDSSRIATKIRSASGLCDPGRVNWKSNPTRACPNCEHIIDNSDVTQEWPGLPRGVKFDPSDPEIIWHLLAKVSVGNMKPHPFIEEFIPTVNEDDGICYTHPQNLPGVKQDGSVSHFFHRAIKAYSTGTRKRRKIHGDDFGDVRWHKTGRTKPVNLDGVQKGCKKIMVLYMGPPRGGKPEKTNWVMHQYHLGQHEEEKEGELVVSKIFYQTQPRQCNWSDRSGAAAAGEGNSTEPNSRRGESGSCSLKELEVITQRDELSAVGVGVGAAMSSYSAIDIQQLKADHFSYAPFRKSFDEARVGEASTIREASASGTCEEHNLHELQRPRHAIHEQQQQQHQHHQIASTAFHISRPSLPISTIISPPPLHHTSIILDEDSFHVSRIMLQNENFQQQQQQHHKLGGRSASGLEELIMGCTSNAADMKQESSMTNPQEAEWLKYSFWPDPDNPDHHG